MAEPVGEAAWRDLIDRLVVQRGRLAQHDELHRPMTRPRQGASEQQLQAAEARLGRVLDPHYREFLSVSDGWELYYLGYSLLGTADIGAGARWQAARDAVKVFSENSEGYFAAGLGVEEDPDNWQPVGDTDNGYDGCLYQFVHDASGCRAGNVFELYVGTDSIWPDLYTFLTSQLETLTRWADSAELGPHSDPWGRDIRREPPSMADIVAKLADLSTRAAPNDQRARLFPGATQEELDALDEKLSGPLHPEHRELLATTNGMSAWSLGRILSVADLRDGMLWGETITRTQEFEDNQLRDSLLMARTYGGVAVEPKPPVAERITHIPAVPFAVFPSQLYGVDIRDGHVRNLLTDEIIDPAPVPRSTSEGTVREYLLAQCDRLWWQAGQPTP
ncbi:SMI1/KNR4 family protein [Nocardia sp. IFM 10818]